VPYDGVPHELNPEVPHAVSLMVLSSLEEDLREAKTRWLQSKTIARNASWPRRALQTLTTAFARARQGARELVLVTGAAGIGKSALANHFLPPS